MQNKNNWQEVYLKDIVVKLESGKRPKGGVSEYSEGIPSLGGEHLNENGGFKFNKIKYVPIEFAAKMLKGLVDHEDILIVKDGATTGRVSYISESFPYNHAVINEHLFSIKLPPSLNKKWVFYQLWAQNGREQILLDFRGAAQGGISSKFTELVKISIPPLPEQHRIVAKIEALFSELDKGIESFKTAREQLKIYRQALLKHAFSGKLTEQWREENQDKLETAEALIQRIQTERKQRYQQQLKDWEAAGKQGSKPKVPKKVLPPLTAEELATLPKLPGGWIWGKLGLSTCSVEYGTSAKSSESGVCPVLRMGNIQNGKFDWSDLVFTSDESEIEKYLLRNGDVLFNRTNSPELVGKSAIYKSEHPAIFAGYLIRINQIQTIANGQYLNLFLNSHAAKQHGNKVKTDGVNQSNINGEKLSNYPFPFCSIDEQSIIVDLLESRLSIADQLDQTLTTALQQSEALRQSILKKAFSGQLVPQDLNDEPASVLLERIQAEKAALIAPTKKRK